MSLLRPNAQVTLAGRSLSSAEGAVQSVRVDLGLNGAHDGVRLTLWPDSKLASAAPGDLISVALGDAGSEVDVMGGEVLAVRSRPDGVVIEGVSATIALSRPAPGQPQPWHRPSKPAPARLPTLPACRCKPPASAAFVAWPNLAAP